MGTVSVTAIYWPSLARRAVPSGSAGSDLVQARLFVNRAALGRSDASSGSAGSDSVQARLFVDRAALGRSDASTWPTGTVRAGNAVVT